MRYCLFLAILLATANALADWPQLRGDPGRSGYVQDELKLPFRLEWAVEFEGERLGTAMEPIVAQGRVFAATHAGALYALDAESGRALWRFVSEGAFLHSPAVEGSTVIAANTDGNCYGLDTTSGQLRWSVFVGRGGCSAAPAVAEGIAYLGTRAGEFFAIRCRDGEVLWKQSLSAPIRQSAAVYHTNVFVTAEDLRLRCLDVGTGKPIWTSRVLSGQTARDYYPVVVQTPGGTFVVVRTNPVLGMAQRIGRDQTMLCRNAGVDDSSWQKVDAWIKSDAARGAPELWRTEQKAIIEYLQEQPDAQTFFVFEAATGREPFLAPVLWVGGCQSVGAQPAAMADGRLLVFYRSAYGNWNHGVAPLVALGLLDLAQNVIEPLVHKQGRQPPWNLFWGTADESQNFLVIGSQALLIHQGTLSIFDFMSQRLFPGHGNRDTFGGFINPAWARNEWHGPARSGVALANGRVYWQTGSRILCLGSAPAVDTTPQCVRGSDVSTVQAPDPDPDPPSSQWMREELNRVVSEVVRTNWAPLFTEPGLAGRHFSFDNSGVLFEALAWSWPYLVPEVRDLASERLAREWQQHPPYSRQSSYPLDRGEPREFFSVPAAYRKAVGRSVAGHPFGGVHATWLYAARCGQTNRVMESWGEIREVFEDFLKTKWKLNPAEGDLHANRYWASLMAMEQLARLANDQSTGVRAADKRSETSTALLAWWDRAGREGTLVEFKGSAQLDPFIVKGDAISFRVAPHHHQIALFKDLTPELASLVRERTAASTIWATFERLYRTWPLSGEERQLHFGENFVDAPELALSGFEALAWLKQANAQDLARRIDLPSGRADLYYATKLAIALSVGSL